MAAVVIRAMCTQVAPCPDSLTRPRAVWHCLTPTSPLPHPPQPARPAQLELERKLRALLTKEKERAEEEAALAMGLCGGGLGF